MEPALYVERTIDRFVHDHNPHLLHIVVLLVPILGEILRVVTLTTRTQAVLITIILEIIRETIATVIIDHRILIRTLTNANKMEIPLDRIRTTNVLILPIDSILCSGQ